MSSNFQQLLNRALAVLGVALILATGAVFVAHESEGDEAQTTAGAGKAVDKVQIKDFLYGPDEISVSVGTKVTFTNDDSAPHTATSGPSPNADGVFEAGTLMKGDSKSVKIAKAGTFAYYCAIHPFMKATVIAK